MIFAGCGGRFFVILAVESRISPVHEFCRFGNAKSSPWGQQGAMWTSLRIPMRTRLISIGYQWISIDIHRTSSGRKIIFLPLPPCQPARPAAEGGGGPGGIPSPGFKSPLMLALHNWLAHGHAHGCGSECGQPGSECGQPGSECGQPGWPDCSPHRDSQ